MFLPFTAGVLKEKVAAAGSKGKGSETFFAAGRRCRLPGETLPIYLAANTSLCLRQGQQAPVGDPLSAARANAVGAGAHPFERRLNLADLGKLPGLLMHEEHLHGPVGAPLGKLGADHARRLQLVLFA